MPVAVRSSEGLGRILAAGQLLDHDVLDDAVRIDLVLVGHGVAQRLVQSRSLEVKRFEVEARTAVFSRVGLERLDEVGSNALAPM